MLTIEPAGATLGATIRGLDAAYVANASWPGLTRPSLAARRWNRWPGRRPALTVEGESHDPR